MMRFLVLPGVSCAAFIVSAAGQSLLNQPVTQPQPGAPLVNEPAGWQLQDVSLFAVTPPKPKVYGKHDLIEIIINESSLQQFEQSTDTKKDYDLTAELAKFPSIRHLLELQFENGDSTRLPTELGVNSRQKFKGEGEFERKDKITARITATVIDVKPNGNLVLEAVESITSDKESSRMVLSGLCRAEDITKSNTVQSSQLANLVLKVEHEGDVKNASEKGLIPRILEAIFNF